MELETTEPAREGCKGSPQGDDEARFWDGDMPRTTG